MICFYCYFNFFLCIGICTFWIEWAEKDISTKNLSDKKLIVVGNLIDQFSVFSEVLLSVMKNYRKKRAIFIRRKTK